MRTRVISIAGAKGSPGCSFLAVSLARSLASANITTLLVDGDAEGGGVATLLDLGPGEPSGLPHGSAVDKPGVQIDDRLWFVEVGEAQSARLNGLEIVNAARVRHNAVVVDLGHSVGPLQRQLSAASDWLIWVVVPDRSGLHRADRALAAGALGAASAGLVFNRINRSCLARADEVLSGRHRLPVMARIKEDRRIAERLSLGHPVHQMRAVHRPINELARSVHPEAASVAGTWP